MAETAPEPQPDVPAESPEGETPSLSEVNDKVDSIIETLKRIVSPGGDAPHEATPEAEQAAPKEQMKQALKELQAEENAKRTAKERRDQQAADMDELKKTVKEIKERPPKEYRKVTNLVWGRDED